MSTTAYHWAMDLTNIHFDRLFQSLYNMLYKSNYNISPEFFITFVIVLRMELILPRSTPARLTGKDCVVGVVAVVVVVVTVEGTATSGVAICFVCVSSFVCEDSMTFGVTEDCLDTTAGATCSSTARRKQNIKKKKKNAP